MPLFKSERNKNETPPHSSATAAAEAVDAHSRPGPHELPLLLQSLETTSPRTPPEPIGHPPSASKKLISPGLPRMPLRPLIGSCGRFLGLLAAAGCWIALLLCLSHELFPTTCDQLLLGGLGYKGDVDIGLGGDYLGWGDEAGVASTPSSEPYEFGELADTAMLLVDVWHAAVRSLPTWDPDGSGGFPVAVADLVVEWGDLWPGSLPASSAAAAPDLHTWADGWALTGGYLNLSYWLALDDVATPEKPHAEPQLQRLLQAAQHKASQHQRWRLQSPLHNLPGPRKLLKNVRVESVCDPASLSFRKFRKKSFASSVYFSTT